MQKLILSSLALSLLTTPAFADTISPNCAGEKFRQLDFWVGDWNLSWQGNTGVNHIKKSFESCVIEENFGGRPGQHLEGHSVSMYDATSDQWKQTWVDNEGSYIALTGGPQADGTFVFATQPGPKGGRSRMVFEDIKSDSFVWRWQSSTDGQTWKDQWVIDYARKR